MGKISVNVYIPAIGQSCEFLVPIKMAVKDAVKLMLSILASEYGVSEDERGLKLFSKEDGRPLNEACNFEELEVSEGVRLMLL